MTDEGAAAAGRLGEALKPPGPPPDPVTALIARLLSLGTLVSVALVATGSLLATASGRSPGPARPPDLTRVPVDLANLHPDGFLWAGLLLTVALPTARVVLALAAFARTGDRLAALVALAILGVLALSVSVAFLTR